MKHLTNAAYVKRGNCYVASEALYHILGGKAAGWKPMRVGLLHANGNKETHWYLQHSSSGVILDPSVRQFDTPDWWPKPDYSQGIGSGFLTGPPSARARDLMIQLTWHTLRKRQIRPPAGRPATAEAHEGGIRMDVKKLKAAIKTANDELSSVIDGKTKARDLKGFRSLISAGQHLEAAEKQIDKAVEQSKPKAPAANKTAA